MEISPEPTCPGHKRNQESLNADEAGRPMRTSIYFIFLSYFISVTSDTAQRQVYILSAYPAPGSGPGAGQTPGGLQPAPLLTGTGGLPREAESQPPGDPRIGESGVGQISGFPTSLPWHPGNLCADGPAEEAWTRSTVADTRAGAGGEGSRAAFLLTWAWVTASLLLPLKTNWGHFQFWVCSLTTTPRGSD